MWEAFVEDANLTSKIFRSRRDAEEWLAEMRSNPPP
jgi:hypothetical protein